MYFGGFKLKVPSSHAQNVVVCMVGRKFCRSLHPLLQNSIFRECKKHRKHNKSRVFMTVSTADAAVSYLGFARRQPLGLGSRSLVARWQVLLSGCTVDMMGRSLRLANLRHYYMLSLADDNFTFSPVQCFHVSCCLKYYTDAPNIRPVCSNCCTCLFFFCQRRKVDTEYVSINLFI